MQPHRNRANARRQKVLVLGDDARIVLPIIRSLARRRIDVHLAWCPDDNAATRSRGLKQVHYIDRYVPGDESWLGALNGLLLREQFDLVIPATEGAVYVLQTYRHELHDCGKIYLLDDEAFRTVFSKQETYGLAESLSIPSPASRRVVNRFAAEQALDEFGLPAIIKPSSSVSDAGQLAKHFARIVRTRDDALAYVDYLFQRGAAALLQSYFEGGGVGVELLANRGQVLFAMQHRRLHETTGHGSTYRETMPLDAELLAAAKSLVGALDYTGVAMVEFRCNPATGRWILLEINGRFWGSLPLASAAGADFPWYLYQMLVENRRKFPAAYRTGVRSRSLTEDLRWTWRRLRGKGRTFSQEKEGSLGWAVNDVSLLRVSLHWLRALSLLDHVDTFAWRDPWPAVYEVAQMARKALLKVARRPSRIAQSASSGGYFEQKLISAGAPQNGERRT